MIDDPAPPRTAYCARALGVSLSEFNRAVGQFIVDFQKALVSEEQFWADVAGQLKVPRPKVASLWTEAFGAAYQPRKEMFDLARRIKKADYKVAVLSNTERPAAEFIRGQLYDFFDAIVLSCLEGTVKPEPQIYEITVGKLGIGPAEAIFVDDSEEYVDGAKKAGLNTILFKNPQQLTNELLTLGVDSTGM